MVYITFGIILVAAWLVRRLLGIRKGRWGATFAAVVIGEAASIGILQLITGNAIELGWEWFPVGITLVLSLSMLAATLIELLGRPRTSPRVIAVPHPVRALRRRVGRTARYVQVSTIAAQSGLFGAGRDQADEEGSHLGRALASTFERSGGLFVKLGQAMASQPQLVTPAVAAQLARLQDQAAPADPAAALAVLEQEIGPIHAVFETFGTDPVATASIGQTYFATLLDGRSVVVKVQRPGIRDSMDRDLDILARLADRLQNGTTWAKSLGIGELAAGFADSTREELNFRIEAANGIHARESLKPTDLVTVPAVMDEYTTSRVLVQERVPGGGIGTPGIFDGMSDQQRTGLADALLSVMVRQMLSGGQFHADPHAGNVFIRPDGLLALIDYGAVGRLNSYERIGLVDLFRGLQIEDPSLVRQAALRFGTPSGRIDSEALDRELSRLLGRAVQPGGRLDPGAIGEILFVFRDFGIGLPRSITALFRTLYTLMGSLEVIAPGYDLVGGVGRVSGQAANPLGRNTTIKEFLENELMSLGPVLSRIPGNLDEMSRTLLRGDLRARVSLFSEADDVTVIWNLLNRFVLTIIGSAGLIASALLLTIDAGTQMQLVTNFVGGIGFAFSTLLLLRTITQILRRRDRR